MDCKGKFGGHRQTQHHASSTPASGVDHRADVRKSIFSCCQPHPTPNPGQCQMVQNAHQWPSHRSVRRSGCFHARGVPPVTRSKQPLLLHPPYHTETFMGPPTFLLQSQLVLLPRSSVRGSRWREIKIYASGVFPLSASEWDFETPSRAQTPSLPQVPHATASPQSTRDLIRHILYGVNSSSDEEDAEIAEILARAQTPSPIQTTLASTHPRMPVSQLMQIPNDTQVQQPRAPPQRRQPSRQAKAKKTAQRE